MDKNYKLQNTNYKGGGTPGLLGILNYNVQNYKQKTEGSHGLHQGAFKLRTMTGLIKSFCGGVQGGQFFQKAPPLVAEGQKKNEI
jgi:hypothetical protein